MRGIKIAGPICSDVNAIIFMNSISDSNLCLDSYITIIEFERTDSRVSDNLTVISLSLPLSIVFLRCLLIFVTTSVCTFGPNTLNLYVQIPIIVPYNP